jgi:hypothetical protein
MFLLRNGFILLGNKIQWALFKQNRIMIKQEAKQQIAKLVEKYQRIAEAGKIKSYNEAQTRNEFIEPLFEYLGWDMRNLTTDNEVTTEENVSGGRVDLAFRFNNIPVMFLEAKAMKVDLGFQRKPASVSWRMKFVPHLPDVVFC